MPVFKRWFREPSFPRTPSNGWRKLQSVPMKFFPLFRELLLRHSSRRIQRQFWRLQWGRSVLSVWKQLKKLWALRFPCRKWQLWVMTCCKPLPPLNLRQKNKRMMLLRYLKLAYLIPEYRQMERDRYFRNDKRQLKGFEGMKKNRWNILWGTCLCLATVLLGQSYAAVKLGQSCALTGGTAFLGQQMHKGATAYFDAHAGGDIELLVKDDGYEPDRCEENTEIFLREGVDALFGYVGTPTSKVAVPLVNKNNVLFFGPFTGAGFLSDVKKNPNSFSVRASYDAEVENMMRHLKEDLGLSRIGIFVQRDAFGMAGVRAVVQAQEQVKGMKVVPQIPALPGDESSMDEWNAFWKGVPNYRRNTVSVGEAVRQVRGQAVDAVILVGASRPCALAINQWHKMGFKVPMLNISFVGSGSLARRLKSTENVYISQVVPDPWDNSIPLVKEYQQDMGADDYGFVSLEGYLNAKVLHNAITRIQGEVTTAALKDAVESMSAFDAGGLEVTFGKEDHRGLDTVYLTKIVKSDNAIQFSYVDALSPPEK
ncbi:MAG: hypothetical protein D3910_08685 [Candidatus Electrothrix sp. ATG2]|nr:hypothetical protein [Candidatus Electrothrix sp. ATG2]